MISADLWQQSVNVNRNQYLFDLRHGRVSQSLLVYDHLSYTCLWRQCRPVHPYYRPLAAGTAACADSGADTAACGAVFPEETEFSRFLVLSAFASSLLQARLILVVLVISQPARRG